MPRIVALSDTHRQRPQIPDGDILIHAGDVCGYGHAFEFEQEMRWLGSLPHAQKLFTPGNHDRCVEYDTAWAHGVCALAGVRMFIDAPVTLDAIRFYFSPRTPIFLNWAFMQPADVAKKFWKRTPECDVLVTHGPPRGIHEACPEHVGCPELLAAVTRIQPRVHLHGHIHEHFSSRQDFTWANNRKTLFANISALDAQYRMAAEPLVFDIERLGDEILLDIAG